MNTVEIQDLHFSYRSSQYVLSSGVQVQTLHPYLTFVQSATLSRTDEFFWIAVSWLLLTIGRVPHFS